VLFAIPDQDAQANRFEVAVPQLASLYLTHSWDGQVTGLKAFAREDQPPVLPVFFAFRVMVGIGMLMLLVAWWGAWLAWRGKLEHSPRFLRIAQWMGPSGFIAVLAGWVVTEMGRQPWTVYGLLRTAESVSPTLTGLDVFLSLLFYQVVYLTVYAAAGYYLLRLIQQGPDAEPLPDATARPTRPLSASSIPLESEVRHGH